MTKAEILSQIKTAEKDAELIISQANEVRTKRILDAKNQSRELIEKARKESQNIGEKKIAQAKTEILSEKEKLSKEGLDLAESIKSKAKKNLAQATEILIEQFERAVHA